MKKLTKGEKDYINETFSGYIENENLESADIFHMYSLEKTGMRNNGYVDAIFFDLVAYNRELKQYKKFEWSDKVSFNGLETRVDDIRIFLDGSTLFTMVKPVGFFQGQAFRFVDLN